jgi:hypothetical protein
MKLPPLPPSRYERQAAPAVVPAVWRWLARCILLLGAFACSYYVGKTTYDLLRRVHPTAELSWPVQRAIKPARMGAREFTQNVGLERRYVEDSMRSLLPASINVLTIWSTCGEATCVRPSLVDLMSLLPQAKDPVQFTQRVCGLGTRFLGSNIAGVVWEFDAARGKCVAANWETIQQEVKAENNTATISGLIAAVILAVLLIVVGVLVLRAIERRIDDNDREISIES